MIETLTALFFAHVCADFLLQTNWIHANKRRARALLLHGVIVLVCAQAALGRVDSVELLALALAHVAIDAIKTRLRRPGLAAFLLDQGAHLATLAALAFWSPDLWAGGIWARWPGLLPLMALAGGAITALIAGQYAVGLLMRPHASRIRDQGLRRGGRQIGLLERALVFVLLLADLAAGIGFLVAAKSLLRFGTAARDQRSAEYVIIGTLASFGWALLAALATRGWLDLLPPLALVAR
ncbi:DUF3307 domain-containing protein [Pontibaca methylaminivorans]|uniref:DUF3307 domain-containing protein n=1 Tax=Pontibaca methylaminivorans TaxID=515897 RepID=UPI002FD99590